MGKSRLEAFSDGVIAIIITIMVLEMKVPQGTELRDLIPLAPIFFSYVLSFVFVGIYWNNHHHMLSAVNKVNGRILWANTHLLFWLSLIPFVTGWMGEHSFDTLPVALYGTVLLMAALAYFILSHCLIAFHGKSSTLAQATGNDIKGKISLVIYAAAIPLAFVNQWLSVTLYIIVSVIWFTPDKRIEKKL